MGRLELYEVSLVVNRLQEKAIRGLFKQHNWQFIIAGVQKCKISELPVQLGSQQKEKCEDLSEDVTSVQADDQEATSTDQLTETEEIDTQEDYSDPDNPASPDSSDYSPTPSEVEESRDSDDNKPNKGLRSRQTKPVGGRICTVTDKTGVNPKPSPKASTSTLSVRQTKCPSEERKTESKIHSFTESADTQESITDSNGVVQRKDFECTYCCDRFVTFREFRLHLQQHKRSGQGGGKLTGIGKCNKDSSQTSTSSNRNELSFGGIARGSGGEQSRTTEKDTPRRPGRPRKHWPVEVLDTVKKKVGRPPKLSATASAAVDNPPIKVEGLGIEEEVPKKYTCVKCPDRFSTFRELRLHLAQHKKSVDDSTCSVSQGENADLSEGSGEVNAENSRQCKTCGKMFKSVQALIVHDRVHSGERPYLCNQCGKAFKQVSSFQSHVRTHTGEAPFKCTLCDMAFRHCGELHRHKRRHTGEKPQLCPICGKRFAEHSYLKSHMRLHTGEKPFSCNLCEKSFSQRTSLKVHLKSHYKDVCELGGNPPVMLSLDSTEDVRQTPAESNEKTDSRETQPMPSEFIPMDFRINNQQSDVNNPHTQDHSKNVENDGYEIQSMSLSFIPTQNNKQQSDVHSHGPFRLDHGQQAAFLPESQFGSVNPSVNIQPAPVSSYNNNATALFPTHLQYAPPREATAHEPPWIPYHTNTNIAGLY